MTRDPATEVGVVIIGRNEGARLVRCLAAVSGAGRPVVYVDSGSTDGSSAAAEAAGAQVVALDMRQGFTAARARNAGFEALMAGPVRPDFVQFIDGDCEVDPAWIDTAHRFLLAHPQAAVACGRLRERFPEASVYNGMIDTEWDTPVGQVRACGGIAMMRTGPFADLGGFNPNLIAGEEPELCVRLRQAGWQIWRLEAEMALHDVAMTRFSQYWRRSRRAGHAFAEGALMHGAPPERHKVAEQRRALLWGLGPPALALVGLPVVGLWSLLALGLWPAQMLRLSARGRALPHAALLTISKLPEALGVVSFHLDRLKGRRAGLIEYK